MCHLSIEKALKGLYTKLLCEVPPKTHSLIYLLNKTGKKPDSQLEKFIFKLNTASIVTRYPDNLEKAQATFTNDITREILQTSREVLKWINTQF